MFCHSSILNEFPTISDVGPVSAHQISALLFLWSGTEPWLKKLLLLGYYTSMGNKIGEIRVEQCISRTEILEIT
jgi:hypothetical protein